jgi:hypothetical protein
MRWVLLAAGALLWLAACIWGMWAAFAWPASR